MKDGRIAMSAVVSALVRSATAAGNGPFRRLGLG